MFSSGEAFDYASFMAEATMSEESLPVVPSLRTALREHFEVERLQNIEAAYWEHRCPLEQTTPEPFDPLDYGNDGGLAAAGIVVPSTHLEDVDDEDFADGGDMEDAWDEEMDDTQDIDEAEPAAQEDDLLTELDACVCCFCTSRSHQVRWFEYLGGHAVGIVCQDCGTAAESLLDPDAAGDVKAQIEMYCDRVKQGDHDALEKLQTAVAVLKGEQKLLAPEKQVKTIESYRVKSTLQRAAVTVSDFVAKLGVHPSVIGVKVVPMLHPRLEKLQDCALLLPDGDLPDTLPYWLVEIPHEYCVCLEETILKATDCLHPTHADNMYRWTMRTMGSQKHPGARFETFLSSKSYADLQPKIAEHEENLKQKEKEQRIRDQAAAQAGPHPSKKDDVVERTGGGRLAQMQAQAATAATSRAAAASGGKAGTRGGRGGGAPAGRAVDKRPRVGSSPAKTSSVAAAPTALALPVPKVPTKSPASTVRAAVIDCAASSASKTTKVGGGGAQSVLSFASGSAVSKGVSEAITGLADATAAVTPVKHRPEEERIYIGQGRLGSQRRALKALDIYSILIDNEDPGREISASQDRIEQHIASKNIQGQNTEEEFCEYAISAKAWMVCYIAESRTLELQASCNVLHQLQGFKMPFMQKLHFARKVGIEYSNERRWDKLVHLLTPLSDESQWDVKDPRFPSCEDLNEELKAAWQIAWNETFISNGVLQSIADITDESATVFMKLSEAYLGNDAFDEADEFAVFSEVSSPATDMMLALRAVCDPLPGVFGSTAGHVAKVWPTTAQETTDGLITTWAAGKHALRTITKNAALDRMRSRMIQCVGAEAELRDECIRLGDTVREAKANRFAHNKGTQIPDEMFAEETSALESFVMFKEKNEARLRPGALKHMNESVMDIIRQWWRVVSECKLDVSHSDLVLRHKCIKDVKDGEVVAQAMHTLLAEKQQGDDQQTLSKILTSDCRDMSDCERYLTELKAANIYAKTENQTVVLRGVINIVLSILQAYFLKQDFTLAGMQPAKNLLIFIMGEKGVLENVTKKKDIDSLIKHMESLCNWRDKVEAAKASENIAPKDIYSIIDSGNKLQRFVDSGEDLPQDPTVKNIREAVNNLFKERLPFDFRSLIPTAKLVLDMSIENLMAARAELSPIAGGRDGGLVWHTGAPEDGAGFLQHYSETLDKLHPGALDKATKKCKKALADYKAEKVRLNVIIADDDVDDKDMLKETAEAIVRGVTTELEYKACRILSRMRPEKRSKALTEKIADYVSNTTKDGLPADYKMQVPPQLVKLMDDVLSKACAVP
eukprot:TRINITY_DN20039_c0_g1_i3.p1 TRINITY_DN20039_c0_g1~~TRINITY_DN20039_c0_g1_i3.p1  ORF type:complete len:1298 (+),score=353.59 TRINITY_DN20039_c0_g1_i3:98-3991(+)